MSESFAPGQHGCGAPRVHTRPLRAADLDSVLAIQRAAYGDAYQESAAVLGRKLALAPRACWLAEIDGQPVGYVFAHPWHDLAPPPLHVELVPVAAVAQLAFVHDLAVAPAARGAGVAAALFSRVRQWSAQARHRRMLLVALKDAPGFWQRHGFRALARSLPPGYGDGACLMERALVS